MRVSWAGSGQSRPTSACHGARPAPERRFANAPMPTGEIPTLATRRLCRAKKERTMGLGTILLIVLVLLLLGAIPSWPHSKNWGYGPSGGLGLLLVIVVVLLLMGRL